MKLITILIFTLFSISQLFSQSYKTIRVVDAKTKEPLAYARIYNVETGRGLVTNEDGVFRYAFKDTITREPIIRLSYVGYESKFFSPVEMNSIEVIKLKTNTYALAEVLVMPKSWAMDFLHRVIEKHVSQPGQFHNYKAYLIANSTIDDTPVELIQAYYNGMFNPFTVDSLTFKNGRISHAPFNNNYFLNLNPASLFRKFHPFSNQKSSFPASFTANVKIKNMLYYDVKLSREVCSEKDTLLYFNYKSKVRWLMDCEVVVKKTEMVFQSLRYQTYEISHGVFQPINKDDEILAGSIAITIDFHPEQHTIQSMDLQYDIDYLFGTGQKSKIKYDSKLIAMEGAFPYVPKILSRYKLNTYDLTLALNYCNQLWLNNGVVLSEKQNQNLEYFKQHGSLVNYGNNTESVASPYTSLWRWNNSTIHLNELNSADLFKFEPRGKMITRCLFPTFLILMFKLCLMLLILATLLSGTHLQY